MPSTNSIMGDMPTLCMSHGEPTHKFLQISVLLWIDDEVPVIRHELMCKQPHVKKFLSLAKNVFEGEKIRIRLENRQSSICTIDNVVDHISNISSERTWHCSKLNTDLE